MTMTGSFGMGGFQSVFSVLFALGFLVFLGIFLAVSIRSLGQWNKNNRAPRLTVGALVTAKRTNVSHHRHSGAGGVGHTTRSTTYYATFEVESGDRMELQLSGQDYGLLAEGDRGYLTFQGSRYLGFEREQQ